MLPPLPRCSDCVRIWSIPQSYQSSPIQLSGRPAHRPFRGLFSVHSRCGLHTRAATVYRGNCYPKASSISLPPYLFRLLLAGAVARWDLHPQESAAFARRTLEPVLEVFDLPAPYQPFNPVFQGQLSGDDFSNSSTRQEPSAVLRRNAPYPTFAGLTPTLKVRRKPDCNGVPMPCRYLRGMGISTWLETVHPSATLVKTQVGQHAKVWVLL